MCGGTGKTGDIDHPEFSYHRAYGFELRQVPVTIPAGG